MPCLTTPSLPYVHVWDIPSDHRLVVADVDTQTSNIFWDCGGHCHDAYLRALLPYGTSTRRCRHLPTIATACTELYYTTYRHLPLLPATRLLLPPSITVPLLPLRFQHTACRWRLPYSTTFRGFTTAAPLDMNALGPDRFRLPRATNEHNRTYRADYQRACRTLPPFACNTACTYRLRLANLEPREFLVSPTVADNGPDRGRSGRCSYLLASSLLAYGLAT